MSASDQPQPESTTISPIRLRELLAQHFNLEELKDLCFELGLDYESLGGEGKSAKARELVAYTRRRGRLAELQTAIRQRRPNLIEAQLTTPLKTDPTIRIDQNRHSPDKTVLPDSGITRPLVAFILPLLVIAVGPLIAWLILSQSDLWNSPIKSTGQDISWIFSRYEYWVIALVIAWGTGMPFLFRRMKWRPTRLLSQLVAGEKTGSPFRLYNDYGELAKRLLPGLPNTPLTDRVIPYVDRKRQDIRLAFRSGARILIRGCTKRGKTREVLEILRENWLHGFNVLVPEPGSRLGDIDPATLSQLPTRNIVLVLDDLHYRFKQEGPQTLKCIQSLERHCGTRAELIVIATVRDEAEFHSIMRYDAHSALWAGWQSFQLQDVSVDEAAQVIRQVAGQVGIRISDDLIEALAHKNDGTFLNLVMAFRDWASRKLESLGAVDIEKFHGKLAATWEIKWNELKAADKYVESIGSAIRFLYDHGLPVVERVVIHVAFWQRAGIIGFFAYDGIPYAIEKLRIRLNNFWNPWPKSGPFQRNPILRRVIAVLLLLPIFLISLLTAPIGWAMRQYDVFISKRLWRALARVRAETPYLSDILIPYEAQVESFSVKRDGVIVNNEAVTFSPSSRFFKHVLAREVLTQWIRIYTDHQLIDAAMWVARQASDLAPDDRTVALIASETFEAGNDLQRASETLEHIATHTNSLWRVIPLVRQVTIDFKRGKYHAANRITDALNELFPQWRFLAQLQLEVKYKLQNPDAAREVLTRWLSLKPAPEEVQAIREWLVEQPKIDATASINHQLDQFTHTPSFRLRALWQQLKQSFWQSRLIQERRRGNYWLSRGIGFVYLAAVIVLGAAYLRPEVAHLLYLDSLRGQVNLAVKRYAEAQADFTRVLEFAPNDTSTLINRAKSYRNLGQTDKALADYTRAVEIAPGYVGVFQDAGESYRLASNYQTALTYINRGLEISPTNASLVVERGAVYLDQDSYTEALAAFNKAVQLSPDREFAYACRGETYRRMEKYDEALIDLTRAINLQPRPWTLSNRALIFQTQGRYTESLSDFATALSNNPNYGFAYYGRAFTYMKMNQLDKAQADMQRAIELEPDNAGYKSTLLQIQEMRQAAPTPTP